MPEQIQIDQQRVEGLGPAERVVQAVSAFTDHLIHNRPGIVITDPTSNIGVKWSQATWRKQEDGSKHVFRCDITQTGVGKKAKKATKETLIGVLDKDGKTVRSGNRVVGEYRLPGVYPEVAVYLYKQIADVFKMDADFAAHWASWAFAQDRRDLKTVLAAFMLTQKHAGEPVRENGEVLFYDDDFRSVGEAMILLRQKGQELNPKQVLLIGKILRLPEIHQINRELGFARSAKNPQMRRYEKAVTKWLRYREDNPRMLAGLVKGGMSGIARDLAKMVGYKPRSQEFFKALRWKQNQAEDGRRTVGLDMELEEKETWKDLTEAEVCERIVADQPGWKVLVGMLPEGMGLTRAIFAAAVEAGCLSDKDMIILMPTIEELGLLDVEPVKTRLKDAIEKAEDQRARHIARNLKSKDAQEMAEEAADVATAKAIEKVTRNLRVYFILDKSGSMEQVLETAKKCLSLFVGGFPLDRTHISVFNTFGTEIVLQAARSQAVAHAFDKHRASGGTRYGQGVKALQHHKPEPGEDALFIFAGDGHGEAGAQLAQSIRDSGINPVAFIWGKFTSIHWGGGRGGSTVLEAAKVLGIPCAVKVREEFEQLFDDPYAVTQQLTNLIAATPVGEYGLPEAPVRRRETLVEQILKTPLLLKPTWAV
jgi:hypothetical protein